MIFFSFKCSPFTDALLKYRYILDPGKLIASQVFGTVLLWYNSSVSFCYLVLGVVIQHRPLSLLRHCFVSQSSQSLLGTLGNSRTCISLWLRGCLRGGCLQDSSLLLKNLSAACVYVWFGCLLLLPNQCPQIVPLQKDLAWG